MTIWKLHCDTCKGELLYSFFLSLQYEIKIQQWKWHCIGLFKHQTLLLKILLVWNFPDMILNPSVYPASSTPEGTVDCQEPLNRRRNGCTGSWKWCGDSASVQTGSPPLPHFHPGPIWGHRTPEHTPSQQQWEPWGDSRAQGDPVAFWIPSDITGCHHSLWIAEEGQKGA